MKIFVMFLALSFFFPFAGLTEDKLKVDWKLKAKQEELAKLRANATAMAKDFELCQIKIAMIQEKMPKLQKQIKALQEEIKKLKEKKDEKTIDKPSPSKPVSPAK